MRGELMPYRVRYLKEAANKRLESIVADLALDLTVSGSGFLKEWHMSVGIN